MFVTGWVSTAISAEGPCSRFSEERQHEKPLFYPLFALRHETATLRKFKTSTAASRQELLFHLCHMAVKRTLHSLSPLTHMCKAISEARDVLPRYTYNVIFFMGSVLPCINNGLFIKFYKTLICQSYPR